MKINEVAIEAVGDPIPAATEFNGNLHNDLKFVKQTITSSASQDEKHDVMDRFVEQHGKGPLTAFLDWLSKNPQNEEFELTELESPEEKKARHQRDLDALERDLRKDGHYNADFQKAATSRRLRMTRDKFKGRRSEDIDEASYEGNIGFEEVMKFFVVAEKKDPALAIKVEELIENEQDVSAWKIIQEFLGVELKGDKFHESATAGSTSAGAIASIANPHLSPGKARGNKSYTGSPGKSGTKAPPQPKVVQKKNADGTAKGAAEVGGNLFGGTPVKR